jgi:hypothetical protein
MALVGGAFWGGMNMGKAQAQDQQNSFFASRGFDPNNLPGGANGGTGGTGGTGGAGGFFGAGGQGAGGVRGQRGATGTIEKIDGNTITLTTAQGDTVTINITDSTPILMTTQGTKSDLKVGTHILAIGQRSGNNVSATGVQITDRPAGMDTIFGAQGGFGGQGGRGGTPTPTPSK